MSSLSAIALDRLLEPTSARATARNANANAALQGTDSANRKARSRDNNAKASSGNGGNAEGGRTNASFVSWPRFLYMTPKATPPADEVPPFNESPYVLDVKRHGPPIMKDISVASSASDGKGSCAASELLENEAVAKVSTCSVDDCGTRGTAGDRIETESNSEEFVDFDDAISFGSSVSSYSDENVFSHLSGISNNVSNSTSNEFYDALEDISSEDGSSQSSESSNRRLQSELDSLKVKYLKESKMRMSLQQRVNKIEERWEEIRQAFSSCGLSFPSFPSTHEHDINVDMATDICRQMEVARFVSGAVGRGSMRAELEQQMEKLIESKNTEISRLQHKLQYYEIVNRELSERNQEAICFSREQRHIEMKKAQKWLWTSVAAGVSIGTIALTLRHFPIHKWKTSFMTSDTQLDS